MACASDRWKAWCRLCSKENGNIDVFKMKDENFYCLSDMIQKFLAITITIYDESPKKICLACHQILSSLVNFSIQTAKVQEMFSELTLCDKFEPITDFDSLREKYGLKFNVDQMQNMTSDKFLNDEEIISTSTQKQKRRIKKSPIKSSTDSDLEDEYQNNEIYQPAESYQALSSDAVRVPINETKPDSYFNAIIEEESKVTDFQIKQEQTLKTRRCRRKHKKVFNQCSSKEFLCKLCDKNFTNKSNYTIHLKATHQIIKESSESHSCSTCGKIFQKIAKLKEHENIHLPYDQRKWYPCPQCDKKFAIEGSIKMHIRTVHVKEKIWICEECGKSFATVDGLNSHKIVHTEDTPFQCPKCDKKFKRLPSLKNHIDSHEDTKYVCPVCGVVLNTKTILRRHMVIHSDEKKYKCNFCGAAFKRAKALKNHLILHTGLKPYQCPFCDQTFANGSNCRKHQKNSHPVELAQMEERGEKRICKNVPRLEHLKAVNDAAIMMADSSNLFPQPVRKILKIEKIDGEQHESLVDQPLISTQQIINSPSMMIVPDIQYHDLNTESSINSIN